MGTDHRWSFLERHMADDVGDDIATDLDLRESTCLDNKGLRVGVIDKGLTFTNWAESEEDSWSICGPVKHRDNNQRHETINQLLRWPMLEIVIVNSLTRQ